jgi:two-component system response regulator MprA
VKTQLQAEARMREKKTAPPKARILVIDDDQMIVNALVRVLSHEGYGIQAASSGEAGLALLNKDKADLVILDVSMPGMSGIDVCRRIKARSRWTPILFLSAREQVADRVKGLESGGDDYLVKPFAFEELVARIEALLRRKIEEKATVLQFADLLVDAATRTARRGDRSFSLSATEYQMLHCFLNHPNRVLSKEQLLEQVWGYGHFAEPNIVEVYVRYLRIKLEQEGEPRLIHTLRGSGYILREDFQ